MNCKSSKSTNKEEVKKNRNRSHKCGQSGMAEFLHALRGGGWRTLRQCTPRK